uniref:Uncharacterized protein n=1 Tax=Rhizophora mucronata TaxID=61149 RepID=A0A2P2PL40_RHIMU
MASPSSHCFQKKAVLYISEQDSPLHENHPNNTGHSQLASLEANAIYISWSDDLHY